MSTSQPAGGWATRTGMPTKNEPELERRQDPESWRTEPAMRQIFVPHNSPLIGREIEDLTRHYQVELRQTDQQGDKKTLVKDASLFIKGSGLAVRTFIRDLFGTSK